MLREGHVKIDRYTTTQEWLGRSWPNMIVLRDQAVMHNSQVIDGIHLDVRTCAPVFRISRTAGRNALKFVVWLEAH